MHSRKVIKCFTFKVVDSVKGNVVRAIQNGPCTQIEEQISLFEGIKAMKKEGEGRN